MFTTHTTISVVVAMAVVVVAAVVWLGGTRSDLVAVMALVRVSKEAASHSCYIQIVVIGVLV